MGGTESRFNALLVEGNETGALELWHGFPDMQVRFRPQTPIKSSPYRDTPLHAAARASMKTLTVEFLRNGADPHARNANGETAIHLVCRSARFSSRTNALRAELLRQLLERTRVEEMCEDLSTVAAFAKEEGDPEREGESKATGLERQRSTSAGNIDQLVVDPYNLGVEDKNRNTPLHLAAASGLLSCVELLIAHKAPLFVFNIAGQTPCDVAAEAKQLIIAKLLESKMVFTSHSTEEEPKGRIISKSRNRSFYNTQSLTELRHSIVKDMAAELKITEFSSQALLMAYGWSEDLVKEAWSQDREGACQKAGLDPDAVVLGLEEERVQWCASGSLSIRQCGICYCDYTPDQMVQIPCMHHFCAECWKSYLKCEIEHGVGKEIRCPGHECYKIIPTEIIANLVPPNLFDKYIKLNLKVFVDNYSPVKWCPYPDCESAVSLREGGGVGCVAKGGAKGADLSRGGLAVCGTRQRFQMGVNVECCQGHGFCWHCMKEPHEPCSCELWGKWKEVITSSGDLEGSIARAGREAAANAQWIVNYTKPCPHCSAPIQKNDGCNHITCKKCRYDFCWVCLDPWHLHSHKTGGYFSCNRFKEQREADAEVKKARKGLMENYLKSAQEGTEARLKRFNHYHSRYSNHLNSLEIELKLLQDSKRKTKELTKLGQVLEKRVAAAREDTVIPNGKKTEKGATAKQTEANFLDDVIRILLNARRILSASYCIGFFIPPDNNDQVLAHETLQGKLEEVVEMLAQVVNRPYLLTPQAKISETARNVDYLCEEYLAEMREVARAATEATLEVKQDPKPKSKARLQSPPPPPPPHRTLPPPPSTLPPTLTHEEEFHRHLMELFASIIAQRSTEPL